MKADQAHLTDRVRAQERELETARDAPEEARRMVTQLRTENEHLEESTVPREEVGDLMTQLEEQKAKVKSIWRMNCDQIRVYDIECCAKETEIVNLKARLAE